MKKNKRVDISQFVENDKKYITWNDVDIVITPTLSLKDACEFVYQVTQLCFTDDGEYTPEFKDFAIKSCILEKYTNIALPNDVGAKYEIVCIHDIIKTVLAHINKVQLDEIVDAINDKVSNLAQANIEMVNAQLNKLNAEFDNMIKGVSELFDGISSSDVNALTKAFASGAFNEDKFIKEYIHQSKGGNL